LRRLQDLQVTIEVRFVTVTDRFFERIGIDFDFGLQSTLPGPNVDNTGLPIAPFGSIIQPQQGLAGTQNQNGQQGQQQGQQNQQQAGAGNFFTQGPTRQMSNRSRYPGGTVLGMAAPGQFTSTTDVPFNQGSFEVGVPTFGGFNPKAGVEMGIAILSDVEAFFFIQAAQGDSRTNLMFAPKVTLFNGQLGFVESGVARPFVVSLIPTVGFFSTGFQPVIQTFFEGIQLSVTAVVSADRRFVRLTVFPAFTNITDVFTFSFVGGSTGGQQGQQGQQGQGQGGGQGQNGGQFGIGGGVGTMQIMSALFTQQQQQGQQGQQGQNAGAANLTVTVQQPVQERVSVTTTVSVPDGGTVLLGGVKRLREGRNMSGVPILNKIPYVSRLFKNTGVGRETESLMLMVTPRIIIQEEEEELLGIPKT
jgi:general secretion pathway protein D